MRPTTLSSATLLLLAALGNTADTVPEVPPPKSWDKFVVLMWQIDTNAKRDQAQYEALNLHGFHVDRRNDELTAFGKSMGWPFYVDHAADKGYLHLGDNKSKPNVAAVVGKRDPVARPNSLFDPDIIAKLHEFLKERIGAAKGSTAVGYAFDDEIGLGFFCTPAEVDASPRAIAFLQQQLKQEYGSIAKLNAEYGASHPDFASVQPTGFEAVRGQLVSGAIAKVDLAPWCDWRAAMDTHFASVLAGLTTFANSIDGSVPAGFVGGQAPSPWSGYDWRKLSKAVQWVECYDIGASNVILRSFWTQKHPHIQTFFSSKNPKLDSWFLWYYLCQGDRGVIAWPEGWLPGGKPVDNIVALAPTFKEVQGPVSQTIIDGTLHTDGVAIYYSQPSIQVSWALDAACHGKTWTNRASSMDNAISTGGLSRVGWVKSLQDAGVQPLFVHQDHLLDGTLAKKGIRMLVLNRALCLSDAEAAAIKAFAAAGGLVVADHLCGIFDEHGKARPEGALDGLFGVKRDLAKGWFDGRELTEVDGEHSTRLDEKSWAVGAEKSHQMAVVERGLATVGATKGEAEGGTVVAVRNGKAVYLNLSPIGYLLHRSDGNGKAWLDLVADLLKESGIAPRLAVTADGAPVAQIETLFWENGPRTTVCVVKNIDRAASVDGFGNVKNGMEAEPFKIKLEFAKPVKDLRNERTGKAMGAGKSFEDGFVPWEANVYSYAE